MTGRGRSRVGRRNLLAYEPSPRDVRRRIGGVRMFRDLRDDPFERHLAPDYPTGLDLLDPSSILRVRAKLEALPPVRFIRGACRPQWNSVALFFNMPSSARPSGYRNTTAQDARNWLDEGVDPANPTISEFMCRYWSTISYGNLAFGVDTPRDAAGIPLVPTVTPPGGNANDWGGLINQLVDVNAEAIWSASGGLSRDSKRWIPSIVLVQNYPVGASATFGSRERTVGGHTYLIGDITHMRYYLDFYSHPSVPADSIRKFWGTLCHEYAHNFLEFWDLYGPQGCTGYWDLLGDNTPPGRMSEISSRFKERTGWLSYKRIINGPVLGRTALDLRPYTTSGDAIKIVPDPAHNPHEYFLLEYRKSSGTETWWPDRALTEEGLLILHINERLGVSPVWLMRDAPYFDEEFADFSDRGGTLWTGHERLTGVLFPQGRRNAFTRSTSPNSNFYGGRPSGLEITNIRIVGGRCRFNVTINGNPRVAWTVAAPDRVHAGRFTPESTAGGQEIFIRNHDAVALLVHRQAQWLAVQRQDDWIDGWNLGSDNYEVVADLDGDGRDEIYIRSPDWAGVLKWRFNRFQAVTVQHDWIDEWNLGNDNYEIAADVDGDGRDEIYVRSPDWAGVLALEGNRLRLRRLEHDWIDGWNLGPDNSEYAGRFSRNDRDEILIRSPEWLGLLYWHGGQNRLRLRRLEHDWIDGWNLGGVDQMYVGDFDGDGRDEIYIRSPRWAGLIKWVGSRFRLRWIVEDEILDLDPNRDPLPLRANDKSYVGRFMPGRDGVLHRTSTGVAVLTWEGSEMRVRHSLRSRFGDRWALGASDKFEVGDFHRKGMDIADPVLDHIADDLDDVFIHNILSGAHSHGPGRFGARSASLGSTQVR